MTTQAPYPCKGCGTAISRLRYCSAPCRDDWFKRTRNERDAAARRRAGRPTLEEAQCARREAAKVQCVECGGMFLRASGRPQKFCSPDCTHAEARRNPPKKCPGLKAEVRALLLMRSGMAGRLVRIASLQARRQRAVQPCETCNHPVGAAKVKTYPARFCSKGCHRQSPDFIEKRRSDKKKRRARKRVGLVEVVDVLRVFERDGWRCHLCEEMTIEAERGTNHPLGPQLDHVIPLSKGGSHTYYNTACAHRICNIRKSNRIVGKRAEVSWNARIGVGYWMVVPKPERGSRRSKQLEPVRARLMERRAA